MMVPTSLIWGGDQVLGPLLPYSYPVFTVICAYMHDCRQLRGWGYMGRLWVVQDGAYQPHMGRGPGFRPLLPY